MSDPYFSSDRSARRVEAEVLEWEEDTVAWWYGEVKDAFPIYWYLIH
jgi:hypothetical protein